VRKFGRQRHLQEHPRFRLQGSPVPINPKHETIQGVPAYKSIEEIGARVELAVIVTRPQTVPRIVEQCGRSGIKNAIVITSGFAEAGHSGAALERKMLEIARSYGRPPARPQLPGHHSPELGLNATFASVTRQCRQSGAGSQSGAICSAVLDWAKSSNNVGFSSVISLGSTADVDFGEILDYLIYDNRTHYILLYVEGIREFAPLHERAALGGAHQADHPAQGRSPRGGSAAVETHSGMAAGSDVVFDAAVRRAGVVRVQNIGQLFYASKALASKFRPQGKRLAIITNGGGPGRHGCRPRRRSRYSARRAVGMEHHAEAQRQPAADLVARNPVDIEGDATPSAIATRSRRRRGPGGRRHSGHADAAGDDAPDGSRQASSKSRADRQTDAHLLDGRGTGRRSAQPSSKKPAFRPSACRKRRSNSTTTSRPTTGTRSCCCRRRCALSKHSRPETEGAKMLIEAVLQERRKVLSEMESKAILRAFRIPGRADHGRAHADRSPAAGRTDRLPDRHEGRFAGPRPQERSRRRAPEHHQCAGGAQRLSRHHRDGSETHPTARINGVSIEPYLARPNGRELMIGVVRDPIFGPIITFGAGGTEVEVFSDRAVALPPLNRFLAQDLIRSTRAAKLLGEFRNMPPVNLEALEDVLLHISKWSANCPGCRNSTSTR
jgi:acetyltransferase